MSAEPGAGEDEPVPKLPRGKGIRLTGPEIVRVVMTAAMLIAIIVLAKPCGDAVSRFVMRFDNGSGAGSQMPKPANVQQQQPAPPPKGVMIRGDMTEEERKAAIERELHGSAAAGGSGATAGSGATVGSGSSSGSN